MQAIHRGKIKKAPAQEVVEYVLKPNLAVDLERSYQIMLSINMAHVTMLAEEGIIGKDAAGKILKVTKEMAAMKDGPTFPVTTDAEDLYFNLENYLIKQTGIEIGGQQHTARSRNDLHATINRMDARAAYLRISEIFIGLRQALLDLAGKNLETVMSGYTHLQPSEPITFAHYCSAILNVLERDYARFDRAWQSLNLCPLGCGSMGSTTFPVNRKTTAELLGFDTYTNNSIDSVAAFDYYMEINGALALAANTLSRFAQDLYVWATPDYGYVEVDDSVAVCSSIMPQKKNPFTLEYIRAKAAGMEGSWVSLFSAVKNVAYTLSCDYLAAIGYFHASVKDMEAALKLMTVTVATLSVNKERMVETARKNFCTVTELANTLVRHDGLSFRMAHDVVALLVDYMLTNNKRADNISRDEVNAMYRKLLNKDSSLTDDQIKLALDPVRNAMSKKAPGGTAPEEVSRQLQALKDGLAKDEKTLADRRAKLDEAAEALQKRVNALL